MEIQTAVHKIYQQLSVTLERALQANKHHIGKHMPGTLQQITFKGFLDQVFPKNCLSFFFSNKDCLF